MTDKSMTVSNDQAVSREATRSTARYMTPPVDIVETDEGLILTADVPGLDEQNLEISVDQGVLTIEGKAVFGTGSLLWREYAMDGYWRQFHLPETFDASRARAEIRNGVLTLHLPKAEAAKPRKIAIETRH
ncbi:MAG: Hsp20/alpha crystallin family protein [Deltaproteobacteria bacterium]|nr:MAG: Hsp20/alpha crystallin family protein [Deltaproteobacteria bacterium]